MYCVVSIEDGTPGGYVPCCTALIVTTIHDGSHYGELCGKQRPKCQGEGFNQMLILAASFADVQNDRGNVLCK